MAHLPNLKSIYDRAAPPWVPIWRWLQTNTFAPSWLPGKLRHPVAGYLAAALLQAAIGTATMLIFHFFPTYTFPGVLEVLVVALVALSWGAGPSLIATGIGALLLELVILPPFFSWRWTNPQEWVETLLFLLAGCVISVVASQSQQARRKAEELTVSLAAEREQIAQAHAALQASESALREANRQMSDFLSIASHELKNPLASINGYLQLAQRRLHRMMLSNTGDAWLQAESQVSKIASMRASLQCAEQQTKLLARLVNDLLDASRIQSDRLELRPTQCDLLAIVQGVVREQQMLWPERPIRFDSPESSSIPVLADADRIRQVITNYLTNALKYSPADRPVEVQVRLSEHQARILVHDQGPGLPPDEQQRIWERFHRAPGIQAQSGSSVGLGLGLYISRIITERHGGQVGVESIPGQGSTFWFTLPLIEEAAPALAGSLTSARYPHMA